MIMLPNFPVETVLGSHLQAAVTFKSSNGAYFYRCDAFHTFVNWRTGSESFVALNATEEPLAVQKLVNAAYRGYVIRPACSWTMVYASGSGQTLLQAILSKDYHNFDHHYHGPIVLKASSRISAYSPLILGQSGYGNQYGGYSYEETDDVIENLENVYLVPESCLLYMNPDAKANLSILGGSCLLKASTNDSKVVEVLESPPDLQCSQLTISPKEPGFANVTVYDVGLAIPIAASAVVQVVDLEWIKIVSGDKISLMEGKSRSINLMSGINNGRIFDSSQA